ncbi:hypothetical protein TcBrA4_0109610 [Trypanosoma cruzi]|nr:hypothetical protein TcBrA4_0109610 [Trypanosoma cruzi]
MEIELSDDTAQAARISGRSVSVPDVTAQRALRVSTGRPPVYMDSDHQMPSHTAGTEDGIPQQAGMLPRRKHDAVVLHEADRDAFTLARGTPLATVITWLEMHRGTVRAAAVTVPQESGRTECSRPSVLQRQPASS